MSDEPWSPLVQNVPDAQVVGAGPASGVPASIAPQVPSGMPELTQLSKADVSAALGCGEYEGGMGMAVSCRRADERWPMFQPE